MQRIRTGRLAALATLPFVAIGTYASASAHVVKTFGTYSVAIGWLHEPTFVGELNAVQVIVKDAAAAPINDLNTGDLKVQVSQGGRSTDVLPLVPSFDPDTGLGTPGEYTTAIVPTVPGDYSFHLTGAIHGTPVDQSYTSGDTTFDTVKNPSAIEFPIQPLTSAALSQNIARVQGRVTSAQSDASSASDSASRATTLGGVALAVAVILGGAAVVLAGRRRRG